MITSITPGQTYNLPNGIGLLIGSVPLWKIGINDVYSVYIWKNYNRWSQDMHVDDILNIINNNIDFNRGDYVYEYDFRNNKRIK